jgi:uncharacterized protein with von Willebrand factor type A (vWA) domain
MTSPDEVAPGLERTCVRFCRALRDAGLAVPPSAAADLMAAAEAVDLTNRGAFYYAARGLLTADRRDWSLFDATFFSFWRRGGEGDDEFVRRASQGLEPLPPRLPGAGGRPPSAVRSDESGRSGAFGAQPVRDPSQEEEREEQVSASRGEQRASRDVALLSPSEVTSALQLVRPAREYIPERVIRRAAAGPNRLRIDLRGTLRDAAANGGELTLPRYRDLRRQRRRLILLCDASRSMRPFTRAVLGLSYAVSRALDDVEVFIFTTRLSRVTQVLRHRSPDWVLRSLQSEVTHWGGGTQIGPVLSDFNRHWARRVNTSEAIVTLLTDGLDAGDPAELTAEARALRRRCWRLMWLNPLAGGEGFEPRATGMRALLPEVDAMLPCRDLASLNEYLRTLSRLKGWRDVDRALRVQPPARRNV